MKYYDIINAIIGKDTAEYFDQLIQSKVQDILAAAGDRSSFTDEEFHDCLEATVNDRYKKLMHELAVVIHADIEKLEQEDY
tara:strand:- start:684 stop:926 length:243 start_codon:yes stop_codon:yes gene_type:complete